MQTPLEVEALCALATSNGANGKRIDKISVWWYLKESLNFGFLKDLEVGMSKEKCSSCGNVEYMFAICEYGQVLNTYNKKCHSCKVECNENNQIYKCMTCADKEVEVARKAFVGSFNGNQMELFKNYEKATETKTSMFILD